MGPVRDVSRGFTHDLMDKWTEAVARDKRRTEENALSRVAEWLNDHLAKESWSQALKTGAVFARMERPYTNKPPPDKDRNQFIINPHAPRSSA